MKPDQRAFDVFVDEHVDRLVGLSRLLTGNRQDAEDLSQETLARAYRKWNQIVAADNQAAYLRRILLNVHRSRLRRRQVLTVSLELVADGVLASSVEYAELDSLRQALAALPPRQRTAVVLRFYEDLDTSDIADAMHLSESSVRSALSRALITLRSTALTTEPRETRRA